MPCSARITAGVLLGLVACTTRNDSFEAAWLHTCYSEQQVHAVIGDPLPGAPGQIHSRGWHNSMYSQYAPQLH